ncbi:hypothetical protein, partial [Photobacterium sanctipauli]
CILGCVCIAVLQISDMLISQHSVATFLLEWAALDLIWLVILTIGVHHYRVHKQATNQVDKYKKTMP